MKKTLIISEQNKREWMKEIRKEKKLTIRQIAPMLKISWQHYSDIENGRRNPSADLCIALGNFFEVNPGRFLENRSIMKWQ
jgi:DNA-binding XRE family transcriptional regulator